MIRQAADPALTIIYFLERRIIMDIYNKRILMNKFNKGDIVKDKEGRNDSVKNDWKMRI